MEGRLEPLSPDPKALESLTSDLRELRRLLADYADEVEPADPADRILLKRVDALRLVLEAIYGQRITFRGEQRPASGPVVQGAIDVRSVSGYAAAVRAEAVRGSAEVRGKACADEVQAGGEIVGVDIDRIGER